MMKKRFLSILLCLCMVLMLCPVTTFAEGETPEPITQIAVTVDEPALGETPDFEPEFTATPADSVDLAGVSWWKISEDDYTGSNEDVWDEIYEEDVFEEGYYYAVDLCFTPNEYYSLNNEISATVNGKPHDDTYGSVYDEFFDEAYVSLSFAPLEPLCTLTVPFTTTVKLGDAGVPGETTFELAVIDSSAGDMDISDVTVSGSVTTNGAGEYDGTLTFTGTERSLWYMLSEGAFVQQVDAGEDGWTVDDTVWGLYLWQGVAELSMDDTAATGYTVVVVPAACEETEDGVYYYIDWDAIDWEDPQTADMTFTNTYTAHAYELKHDATHHWDECACKDVQNKEPHQYGDWKVTKEATKTETGEKEHTCTVCGYTEKAEIAKLPATDPTEPAESNPNTGDSSHLFLWIALLFVGGFGVIGTGVYCKRKRSSRAK